MASRLADLITQAASEGLIDFSKVEFYGKRWRMRLERVLVYLQNKNRREYLQVLHRATIGLLSSGILTTESFDNLKESAADIYNRIVDTYYPSEAKPEEEADVKAADVERATNMWESVFGSLDDPEVTRRVQELADKLSGLKADTFKPINIPAF